MRATIWITIALVFGLALGCPASRAQDPKSNPHQDATADERAAHSKVDPSKDGAQATVPAPPEVITIEGTAPTAAEAKPVVGTQQEQAPPGPARLYTVNSSAEVGWRFLSTEGNFNQFRSDLNFDRGIRLIRRPTNGGGLLFDSLLVNSFGWGGDPSQFVHALVEKTKLYKFDASYRRISYFSNLSNFALGQHTADTQYQVGDFDLTLLPQNNRIKFYLGYSMDYNKGVSFTTYDYQRDEFPITAPTQTSGNDYRFGADASLWIFDLSFMQGFQYFKDDTTYTIPGFEPGNNTTNSTVLNTFQRDMPVRGQFLTRGSAFTRVRTRKSISPAALFIPVPLPAIHSSRQLRALMPQTTDQPGSGNRDGQREAAKCSRRCCSEGLCHGPVDFIGHVSHQQLPCKRR